MRDRGTFDDAANFGGIKMSIEIPWHQKLFLEKESQIKVLLERVARLEAENRELQKDKERIDLIDKGIWDIRHNDLEACFEIHNEAYTLIGCGLDIRTALDSAMKEEGV